MPLYFLDDTEVYTHRSSIKLLKIIIILQKDIITGRAKNSPYRILLFWNNYTELLHKIYLSMICLHRCAVCLFASLLCVFLFCLPDVADKVKLSGVGCYVNMTCMSILLYADDILLVAPSVASLQRILSIMWSRIRLAWYAHQSKEILVYPIWCSVWGGMQQYINLWWFQTALER